MRSRLKPSQRSRRSRLQRTLLKTKRRKGSRTPQVRRTPAATRTQTPAQTRTRTSESRKRRSALLKSPLEGHHSLSFFFRFFFFMQESASRTFDVYHVQDLRNQESGAFASGVRLSDLRSFQCTGPLKTEVRSLQTCFIKNTYQELNFLNTENPTTTDED